MIISWRFWGFDFPETLVVHIIFSKIMGGEVDTTSIEDKCGDQKKLPPTRSKVRFIKVLRESNFQVISYMDVGYTILI